MFPHNLEPVLANEQTNASDEEKNTGSKINHTRRRVTKQHIEQSSGMRHNPPVEDRSKHGKNSNQDQYDSRNSWAHLILAIPSL
jgi:hypothetical protein